MLRTICAFLVALSIAAPAYAQTDAGLVAHWTFDEGKGNLLHDRSGSNHHGRIVGAKWHQHGEVGALRFDGRGDHVAIDDLPGLQLGSERTFEAWLHLAITPLPAVYNNYDRGLVETNWTIFDNEQYPTAGVILRVGTPTGPRRWARVAGQCFSYRSNTAAGNRHVWSRTRLQNNATYHVVLVREGEAAKLYLNGSLSDRWEVPRPDASSAPFTLGRRKQSFQGHMYDVKIHNRALSAADVHAAFEEHAGRFGAAPLWQLAAPSKAAIDAVQGPPGPGSMLLSQSGPCWVVTSSIGNYDTLYSDNLLDRKAETCWRSYQETREEWVDVCWELTRFVDQVRLHIHELSRFDKVDLYARKRDSWVKIGSRKLTASQVPQTVVVFRFPVVETDRLRAVMQNEEARYSGLREIEVFGPTQPIVTIGKVSTPDRGPWCDKWVYVPANWSGKEPEGHAQDIIVDAFEVRPHDPRPGDTVQLRLNLRPPVKVMEDYALVVTIGRRETIYAREDYGLIRQVLRPGSSLSEWPSGRTRAITTEVYIPHYAPHGKLDVMLHSMNPSDGPPLRLVDTDGLPIPDGRLGEIDIRRFARDPKPDSRLHRAEIATSNNGTAISIDGEPIPPIVFPLHTASYDRFHYLAKEAGTRLFSLDVYPRRPIAGDYHRVNREYAASKIRHLLRVVPDAYVFLLVDLRADNSWRQGHPEEMLTTHDGQRAHESFCSKVYRREVTDYLSDLVSYLQHRPALGSRVIGYLLLIGENEGVLSGPPGYVGDYNPQAVEAFRDFVRNRYGGAVDRLREAYADATLTFEKVFPLPEKINEPGLHGGCFLDPATQRLAIDYHEFLASMIPNVLMNDCAATIKRASNGRALVGTYWIYTVTNLASGPRSHQRNHSYAHHVLASPHLDFFSSPFCYQAPARHAGEPWRTNQPMDTMRLNGKLLLPEGDHRTFRAGFRKHGRHFSREETLAVIRRDMATAIMHGMGHFFTEWSRIGRHNTGRLAEDFFLDDEVLAEIGKLHRVYRETIDEPRVSAADTAVFISGTNYYYHDNNAGALYVDLVRRTLYRNLPLIGAPYDELLFEDILKPNVQDGYKCYIFLNAFYMTEAQRAAIDRLKRAGKTLVWLYAPGYVSDVGLSVKNIQRITGFAVQAEHESQRLRFRLLPGSHPITEGVDTGLIGACEGAAHRSYVEGDALKGVSTAKPGVREGAVSPRFVITDESEGVTILGRYDDGKAACAVRDFGTHKSVYCAVPQLPTRALRNIVRFAGGHIYVDEDMYLDATRDMLMLTNTFDRERTVTVNLPRRCDVVTLIDQQPVAQDATRFRVNMDRGQTLPYRLK